MGPEKTILYPKTPSGFLTDCMQNGSRCRVINCYEKLKFIGYCLRADHSLNWSGPQLDICALRSA
jgi:hypothetical protein